MALLLISMLSLSAVMTHTAALDEGFTAASENEEDKILITSGGESLLFDCSSHKNSAGYSSVSFLSENHISELDCYTVANYSATLPDMLDVALSRIKISSVALPEPASEYEREIYSQTERIVAKYRTELFVYDNDGFVFGKYEIIPAYTDLDKAYSYLFATDGSIISYLTSGITDTLPYTNELLYVSNTVIFGDFGTGYSYTKTIDDWDSKLKTIVSFDKDIVFNISFAESVKTRIYTSVKRVKLK
ncbi:MAG: hypothetical protein IKB23_08100 [Clostridia bacterium]|nr:hypothetical protein [Clostridia bacterium]